MYNLNEFNAKQGYIKSIDPMELGLISSSLGGGRAKAGDKISFEVGFKLLKKNGDPITIGKFKHAFFTIKMYYQNSENCFIFLFVLDETWANVYHNHAEFNEVYGTRLLQCIEICDAPVDVDPLIVRIMDFDWTTKLLNLAYFFGYYFLP